MSDRTITITHSERIFGRTITITESGHAAEAMHICQHVRSAMLEEIEASRRAAKYAYQITSHSRLDAIERVDAGAWEHEPVCNPDQTERVA
jgi:hypothetical protein